MQFIKEMEALNNENDFILTQRRNKKTSQLLDVENVNWLVETKLNAMANIGAIEGGVDGMQTEESEQWSKIATRVKDELEGLAEVEEKGASLGNECNELEQMLQQLRAKFLSEHGVSCMTQH